MNFFRNVGLQIGNIRLDFGTDPFPDQGQFFHFFSIKSFRR